MIWVEQNLENVAKAGKPPHQAIQKLIVLTCETIHRYAMIGKAIVTVTGICGPAVLGLHECARHTNSACFRKTVGGKLIEVLATR
jgi:hypothetical protein